jgi:hypothetical protein
MNETDPEEGNTCADRICLAYKEKTRSVVLSVFRGRKGATVDVSEPVAGDQYPRVLSCFTGAVACLLVAFDDEWFVRMNMRA